MIGEALIMIKEISDIITQVKAVVDLANNIMEAAENTVKALLEASRGAMVEVLNNLFERLKTIFTKFIEGIRSLCDIILKAMERNETTDREGANLLKGVIT